MKKYLCPACGKSITTLRNYFTVATPGLVKINCDCNKLDHVIRFDYNEKVIDIESLLSIDNRRYEVKYQHNTNRCLLIPEDFESSFHDGVDLIKKYLKFKVFA